MAGCSTLGNRHLGVENRADSMRQRAARRPLCVAAQVVEAVDPGVGLGSDWLGAVEHGQSAGSSARLRRVARAGHAAVGCGLDRGSRGQARAAEAFLRILGAGILVSLGAAEGDARLVRHGDAISVSGRANCPPGYIVITSLVSPNPGQVGGRSELSECEGKRRKKSVRKKGLCLCGPHGEDYTSSEGRQHKA